MRLARSALGLALATSVACTPDLAAPPSVAAAAEPTRGGVLRLASFADIRSVEPAQVSDAFSGEVVQALYAGLVDFATDGTVQPELAERFEADANGTVLRVWLRPGTRFHDGTEVTAADVKRSLERALHPSAASPFGSYYESLVGYEPYASGTANELAGVRVEGRYVVAFDLTRADATFVALLALPPARPVCASLGTRVARGATPCGAGPFRWADVWEPGARLRVVRHEGYFRPGLPHMDAVEWTFHVGPFAQRLHFERGALDLVRELAQGDAARFLADARWQKLASFDVDKQVLGEAMNTEVPPFDNVEVRRAVAAALDRRAFERLKPGTLRAHGQLLPRALPLFDPEVQEQRFDLAAALEHMRRAGYPYDPATGQGGYPRPIPYVAYRQGLAEYTAQLVQEQLARIGLRLSLKLVSFPSYLATTHRRGAVPISHQGWSQDFPDPSNFFEGLFASRAIADEDGTNVSFYRSARLDELLDEARREGHPEARRKLYAEASRLVVDEAPWAFTATARLLELRHPRVHGYLPHPVWARQLWPVWLAGDMQRAPAALLPGSPGPGRWGLAQAGARR